MTLETQNRYLLRVLEAQSRRIDDLVGTPGELQQALALFESLKKASPETGATFSPAPRERTAATPRTKHGPTEQPRLPVVEEIFELDEADRMCPSCGEPLKDMADQHETSEMVDVVDVSYRIVKVKRQKYVCRCGGCVDTALGPERATKGSRYSLPFAVKVATDKYLDHLPLARQERILHRHGLDVTRQTLWGLTEHLADELEPTYLALKNRLLGHDVIGLDQTSWKRLEHKHMKPWQMWCLTCPDTVFHTIRDDKSAETFKDVVGNFRGVMVCDALSTHVAGARASPWIRLAGCWVHVIRRFEEAFSDHPEAHFAIEKIGALYAIDERAGGDANLRAELRRTESVAVLETLKTWLWSQATLKTLSIGGAARYALSNWERLTVFVEDPNVPLDNNQTERGIHGPVVGRKNHYGSKSRRGTEVAAVFYTLIETAKLNGLDPAQYLRDAILAARRGEIRLPLSLPVSFE